MFRLTIKRLMIMLPILFLVSTASFALIHITPGDPVDIIAGQNATKEQKKEIRSALNLDKPISEQYFIFLKGLYKGDLGKSLFTEDDQGNKEKVTTLISERIPNTVYLATVAILLSLIFSIPLSIIAATNQNKKLDNIILGGCFFMFSTPSFVLAPILILIFCLHFKILPVGGVDSGLSIVLPSASLALGLIAVTTRLLRGSILDTLQKPFIKTAYAKGCSKNRVLYYHVLKNAIMPMITIIFLQIGSLITGTIFIENIFSWPGIGTLLIDAINRRDYMLAQGCIIFIAFVYVFTMFLADVCSAYFNPQIKKGINNG